MHTVNTATTARSRQQEGVRKRAHFTVSEEQLLAGELCSCEDCVRDGSHEPDCAVHDEPKGTCTCTQKEQTEAAG